MRTKSSRVVVAEDDEVMRTLLAELRREDLGLDVVAVADGDEALRAVRAPGVGALVVDLAMPRLDGLSVARAMQADPALRRIPIVAISATVPWNRDVALAAGCRAFIAKPFELATLVDLLRGVIAESAPDARG